MAPSSIESGIKLGTDAANKPLKAAKPPKNARRVKTVSIIAKIVSNYHSFEFHRVAVLFSRRISVPAALVLAFINYRININIIKKIMFIDVYLVIDESQNKCRRRTKCVFNFCIPSFLCTFAHQNEPKLT